MKNLLTLAYTGLFGLLSCANNPEPKESSEETQQIEIQTQARKEVMLEQMLARQNTEKEVEKDAAKIYTINKFFEDYLSQESAFIQFCFNTSNYIIDSYIESGIVSAEGNAIIETMPKEQNAIITKHRSVAEKIDNCVTRQNTEFGYSNPTDKRSNHLDNIKECYADVLQETKELVEDDISYLHRLESVLNAYQSKSRTKQFQSGASAFIDMKKAKFRIMDVFNDFLSDVYSRKD